MRFTQNDMKVGTVPNRIACGCPLLRLKNAEVMTPKKLEAHPAMPNKYATVLSNECFLFFLLP